MKKQHCFALMLAFFLLPAITCALIPLRDAYSQGEPLTVTQQPVRFGSKKQSQPHNTHLATTKVLPVAPIGVEASDGEFTDKIRVTWGSISLNYQVFIPLIFSTGGSPGLDHDVIYFKVYRNKTESIENATQLIGNHPASPFDDFSAESGVTYYYWVMACNTAGCSDFSSPESGWRAVALTTPLPPTDLSASNGDYTDKVHLSWSTAYSASSYQVYRNTIDNHTGQDVLVEDHPSSSYTDMDAVPGVTYYYWIKACNLAGCSDYSNSDLGWRAEITPLPPSLLSASDGTYSDKVYLYWTAAEGAKHYQIYRNTSEIHSGEVVLKEDHTTCIFEDLTAKPAVIYFYWVKACNSVGCSPYSSVDSGWWAENSPNEPSGLAASDGDYTNKVHLSWIPSDYVRYYQIFRNTHNGHDGESVLELSHPTSAYDDLNAVSGVVYHYWVKACNSAGCSTYSTVDSGWRAEITPNTPTGISASDGAYPDKILLSWTAPESASFFQVYRNTANSHTGEIVLTESHPASPYEDNSVIPETTYFYWVKACNSAGCSTYSSPDTGWRSLVNIANGDFEGGNDGSWTVYSKKSRNLILHTDFTSIASHSGYYMAWLGGEDGETARLTQSVGIPPTYPYLHYWYNIDSADTCDYDYAWVRINGTTITNYDLCSPKNTNGWVSEVLDLSAYAGETITLQFEVTTDAALVSNFFLDDVLLLSSSNTPLNFKYQEFLQDMGLDLFKDIY